LPSPAPPPTWTKTDPTAANPRVALLLQLTKPDGTLLTHLSVGDEFVLHAFAQDVQVDGGGVYAAYLNVKWDSRLAVVSGSVRPHGLGISNGNNDSSLPGMIQNAGGLAHLFAGNPRPGEVFSVTLRATGASSLNFTSSPAGSRSSQEINVFPSNNSNVYWDSSVSPAEVDYGMTSVAINEAPLQALPTLPAQQPASTVVASSSDPPQADSYAAPASRPIVDPPSTPVSFLLTADANGAMRPMGNVAVATAVLLSRPPSDGVAGAEPIRPGECMLDLAASFLTSHDFSAAVTTNDLFADDGEAANPLPLDR
jgi:hypothetical protein